MINLIKRTTGWFLAAIAAVSFVGCQPGETMVHVEGQVKHEGKPLTTGIVILHADEGKGNSSKHEPRGVIGTDGRFKVTTHPREGAPPGWYKIAVIAQERSNDPDNPYALPKSLLPDKFGKADESGLAFEVRKDAPPGAYDLDLK